MAVKKTQMYRRNLDGTETGLNPLTESQYVLMENGQTVQEVLSDRDSDKYTPVITNSSSTFKVGQGDNVDLSSSMKEGAYDSCVLKGKTMVNCIQEPSSKDVVLPYEFEDGQYVTINDTKESGALGVELKGQTLVNLSSPHNEREIIFNSRYQVYNVTNDVVKGGLKNGEKIFMSMEVNVHEVNIETLYFRVGTCRGTGGYDRITKTNAEICNLPKNTWVRLYAIREVNEGESSEQYSFWFGMRGEHPTTAGEQIARVSFRNPVWINLTSMFGKGKEPTLSECEKLPYFTGMTSCKMPILHTVGKNLLPYSEMFVSPFTSATPYITKNVATFPFTLAVNGRGVGIKFKVEPNTTYTLSNSVAISNTVVGVAFYKNEGDTTNYNNKLGIAFSTNIEESTKTFTTPNECNWIVCGVYILYTYEQKGGTVVLNEMPKLQLEKNTQATAYEQHKSSILSLPEEVVLRGIPNGVCDVFDTANGILAKKTQEVVLNGVNEKWTVGQGSVDHITGNVWFKASLGEPVNYFPQGIVPSVADRFATHNINIYTNRTSVGICIENHIAEGELRLQMNIPQALIGGTSIEDLKNYLKQNPVTIIVPSNAIATKVNLSSTLKSWNTTTHIYSEIPENTLYPILSHSNPTYPVILKPSTKYSIVANSYSNNHTNSTINFNLGGATASTVVGNRVTTITTPSTLSSELLTMSGRGNKLNNVMVIEGDVVGDEPYFEGICDCKSPILSNVGGKDLNTSKSFPYQGTSVNFNINNIVAGKTYYIYVDVESYNDANLPVIGIVNKEGNNWNTKMVNIPLGKSWIKLTTSTTNTISNVLRLHKKDGLNDWIYVNNIMVFEEEDYKSNILSCNGDKIELTEDMFEQGTTASYSLNTGKTYQWMKENSDAGYDARRLRVKNLIKIKPNTKLLITNEDSFMYNMCGYDINGLSLSTFDIGWVKNKAVTIPSDVHYITFTIRKDSDTTISISDFKNTNFTLSEVDKTIVLRSLPNGVCDTLNVETGEYTRKIGEIIIDGSEDWTLSTRFSSTYNSYYFVLNETFRKNIKYVNDKYQLLGGEDLGKNIGLHMGRDDNNIAPFISSDKMTLSEFKEYLQQNPVTVQYELATPIVSTIDVQGFPYAYANGHVQLSSGSIEQSLTPKVEYSLSANKTGQINSNSKIVMKHQKQLDDFEAMMLTSMVQSAYDKAILQFDYEMRMMSLGGE